MNSLPPYSPAQKQTQKPSLQINPHTSHQPAVSQNAISPQAPPTSTSPTDGPAPPYSPLTPTAVASLLRTMPPYSSPRIIPRAPDPTPIAESDNVDVIALRSAISILQLQRQTAERDVKRLEEIKREALKDPEGYVAAMLARRGQTGTVPAAGLLGPTVGNLVAGMGWEAELEGRVEEQEATAGAERDKMGGDVRMRDSEDSDSEDEKPTQIGTFSAPPAPQNVYRMPPINWNKYHITGGALDQLHEQQKRRPSPGQPEGLEGSEEYVVMAAPYAPVVDAARLATTEHPMVTRRAGKR